MRFINVLLTYVLTYLLIFRFGPLSVAFSWHCNNLKWGNALIQKLEVGNGVPLRPILHFNHCPAVVRTFHLVLCTISPSDSY